MAFSHRVDPNTPKARTGKVGADVPSGQTRRQ